MEENRMFPENGNMVIGVSGGPDSVCLLWLLCALRESHPLDLQVVHVDHGLRQESKEDARFVQKLCEEWGVPCRVVRADVAGVAAERQISKEEAGRLIRHICQPEKPRLRAGHFFLLYPLSHLPSWILRRYPPG